MSAIIENIVQHSQLNIVNKFVSKYGDSYPDITRENLIKLFLNNNKTIIVSDTKPKRGRGRPKKKETFVAGTNIFKIKE